MSTKKKRPALRCEVLVWMGLGEERPCGRKATHYSPHPSIGYCCMKHAATISSARALTPEERAS